MLNKILRKCEFIFKALFTAALTATLIQSGWLAVGIIVFILVVAIAGLELIQADKEQKNQAEAEAKATADVLAEVIAELKAMKAEKKKEGTNNESKK